MSSLERSEIYQIRCNVEALKNTLLSTLSPGYEKNRYAADPFGDGEGDRRFDAAIRFATYVFEPSAHPLSKTVRAVA